MKTAIAFGAFDGLHAGHRAVLSKTLGYKRTAVTFSHLPKFDKKGAGLLMTAADRESALKAYGMDEVIFLDFESVKDMPPVAFLEYIRDNFDPALIACGNDFRFGRSASGDVEVLSLFCEKNGITLSVIPPVKTGERVISSSMIRELVLRGEMEAANSYLFAPYRITATVKKGDTRGRKLGFPTVNQNIPKGLIIPKCGVYAARAEFGGKSYKAVCDIGVRPTYKIDRVAAETHIIGFSGDLYGTEVSVYPLRFLREEIRFSDPRELIRAIQNDIKEAEK